MPPTLRLAPCCLLFALAGCSSSDYDLVPVSGVVQLDGQPVAGARVVFEPKRTGQAALDAGPGSWGKTDAEGRYSLETMNGEPGAVVGLHRVTITTYEAESDRSRDWMQVIRKEEIPAKYLEAGALELDVPAGGTEQADFTLDSN